MRRAHRKVIVRIAVRTVDGEPWLVREQIDTRGNRCVELVGSGVEALRLIPHAAKGRNVQPPRGWQEMALPLKVQVTLANTDHGPDGFEVR